MKLKAQSSIFSDILEYMLPALVFTLSMQLLRVFISGLAWYLRDTVGISTLSLIPYAFGTFFLGFLAAALRRLVGSRNALWVTAGGVAVLRLVEQLSVNPTLDLGLSIAGVGLFLNFLSIFMGHVRMQGDRAARRWVYGVILGLALDIALRGVFGARDLNTISGVIPLLIVAVIVVLVFWALWREPKPGDGLASDAAWKHALTLMAIGPYLVLQMLFFQSQGWVEEVAGLSTPLGFVIVMLGSLAAAAGFSWGVSRQRMMHPFVAIGVAIYLTLAVNNIDHPGGMIVITILIGQLLMGWGWAVVAGVARQAKGSGLWRTTVAVAGGMVLFLALVLAYYIAMDMAMPFPRQVFPTAAAALLGLLILVASLQARSHSEPATWDLSGISAAGVLTIVPLVYWVLLGSAPSPVQPSGLPVKVMSYNLHAGFSYAGLQDLESIAQVIEDSGADIVALQEVSRVRLMDGSADMSAWLSQRLDMPILFRGTEEPIWGNAILSRYPVLDSGWGELPLAGTLIKRGYLWARIDVGGPQPLLVIATHLHHIGADSLARQAQVPVLLRFWDGQGYSLLLGDLNATTGSIVMAPIAVVGLLDSWSEAGVGQGFTFSAGDPFQRIDYIWHSDDLIAVEAQVLQTLDSDHLPVVAILDLAP